MGLLKRKAIFLDRDGTINKEVDYLFRIEDFQFVAGSEEAIKIFNQLDFLTIVISNQSGIARGYYQENDVIKLHKFINMQLDSINGSHIDSFYFCPHHEKGIVEDYNILCNCRKPKIGMIEKAIYDYEKTGVEIDLSESYMVGDKEIDIQFGKNAKLFKSVLVRSGYQVNELETSADIICDDLLQFANLLLEIN